MAPSRAVRSWSSSFSRPTKIPRVERVGRAIGVGGGAGVGVDRFEDSDHLGRTRGTIGGDFGEELQDQGFQIGRAVVGVPAWSHRGDVEVLGDDGSGGIALERRTAGDQLVEHRTKAVEVGLRGNFLAKRLLRRHVPVGADHHPVGGEAGLVKGDGEAEVADLRIALGGEPDVARLEVTVNDPGAVREFKPAGGGQRDL